MWRVQQGCETGRLSFFFFYNAILCMCDHRMIIDNERVLRDNISRWAIGKGDLNEV